MAMLYSGRFYNGNAFINYKYSRKAIRPESALYKVASRLRVKMYKACYISTSHLSYKIHCNILISVS